MAESEILDCLDTDQLVEIRDADLDRLSDLGPETPEFLRAAVQDRVELIDRLLVKRLETV